MIVFSVPKKEQLMELCVGLEFHQSGSNTFNFLFSVSAPLFEWLNDTDGN